MSQITYFERLIFLCLITCGYGILFSTKIYSFGTIFFIFLGFMIGPGMILWLFSKGDFYV